MELHTEVTQGEIWQYQKLGKSVLKTESPKQSGQKSMRLFFLQ